MRTELAEFVAEGHILQGHDDVEGVLGLKDNSAQALASQLADQFGEMLSHLIGHDPVCDFLISSLRDHIEESGIDLDYDADAFRMKLADITKSCMVLHDAAGNISPHRSDRNVV